MNSKKKGNKHGRINMDDKRKLGKLYFINQKLDEDATIYWELISGNFGENSWKASISFTQSFGIPQRVLKHLSGALENPSTKVMLELDDGTKYECVIHDISDLADCGVIDIASPNMGRTRFIINAPTK